MYIEQFVGKETIFSTGELVLAKEASPYWICDSTSSRSCLHVGVQEQAVDREHERDFFQQEIQKLEQQLKNPQKLQAGAELRNKEVTGARRPGITGDAYVVNTTLSSWLRAASRTIEPVELPAHKWHQEVGVSRRRERERDVCPCVVFFNSRNSGFYSRYC